MSKDNQTLKIVETIQRSVSNFGYFDELVAKEKKTAKLISTRPLVCRKTLER